MGEIVSVVLRHQRDRSTPAPEESRQPKSSRAMRAYHASRPENGPRRERLAHAGLPERDWCHSLADQPVRPPNWRANLTALRSHTETTNQPLDWIESLQHIPD